MKAWTVWPCFCLDVSKSRLTYLLQVGWYSLLPLQDQERMSGQQGRIATTLVTLICPSAHQRNKQSLQGMLETEGLVLILFLDLVLLITHPWLWGTWYCLQSSGLSSHVTAPNYSREEQTKTLLISLCYTSPNLDIFLFFRL